MVSSMAKNPREAAKQVLPGWKVVRSSKSQPEVPAADARAPSLGVMRRAYGLKTRGKVPDGLAAASSGQGETEYVVMEPPAGDQAVGRKVVVVTNGKAIAVQG
jgi:hypothetical protein